MTMEAHLSILLFIFAACFIETTAKPQFSAMFVFGDSLSDPGNNIYFDNTMSKANYWPYGIDLESGPTGRYSNGKILVDFIAELLGLPLLPAYAQTTAKGADILSGVNYASAGAGILEDTGYAFGRLIPLTEQIDNFKKTLNQLRDRMPEEELSNYLTNALAFVDIGANDYLNNYLLPLLYKSSRIYNPQQFADLLIKRFNGHILELHGLGLRKFFIAEVAPIGCIPFVVGRGPTNPGECVSSANDLVQMFNSQLKTLVYRLSSDYPGSVFTLGNSFQIFIDLRDNADVYGFRVKDTACCGVGKNKGTKILCPRNSEPCFNRDQYLFWDSAHPTEAANRILAHRVYNETSYCFPVNIQQMATM